MKSLKYYIKQTRQKFPRWKNQSRIVGEAMEQWVINNLHCPKCHSNFCQQCLQPIQKKTPTNFKSVDLICHKCEEKIQIKAKKRTFKTRKGDLRRITGASFKHTVNSLKKNPPSYYQIAYDPSFEEEEVKEVFYIPSSSVTQENVKKRNALSEDARRSGWVGCSQQFEKEQARKVDICSQQELFSDEK